MFLCKKPCFCHYTTIIVKQCLLIFIFVQASDTAVLDLLGNHFNSFMLSKLSLIPVRTRNLAEILFFIALSEGTVGLKTA